MLQNRGRVEAQPGSAKSWEHQALTINIIYQDRKNTVAEEFIGIIEENTRVGVIDWGWRPAKVKWK